MSYRFIKDFLILFSILALLFLSPLFIIIIFILFLTAEGEIFYLQERVGKFSKTLKFGNSLQWLKIVLILVQEM